MPTINTMGNWLRFGAFYWASRVNETMCPLHFSTPGKSSPDDGHGCHAHAKSEHGETRRYPIRGVSSAGMTSAALHARENASMPPRERNGRLGLLAAGRKLKL